MTMTSRTRCVLLALVLTVGAFSSLAQPSSRIQLGQLEEMFSSIRAKTKWNVDGPLLWGYFFFDSDPEKLKRAASELESSGYRLVNLDQVEGPPLYRLHVEKVETHTPASLHARNSQFYSLAERFSLASYDGMDVGPAPGAIK